MRRPAVQPHSTANLMLAAEYLENALLRSYKGKEGENDVLLDEEQATEKEGGKGAVCMYVCM